MSPTPRTPPRFVPTLTDVVATAPSRKKPAAAQGAVSDASAPDVGLLQEQLVHRVMQRVDMSLERRLREAVATLVLEQTRDLGPMLREQIETVVRQSVTEAVADELGQEAPAPSRAQR